MPTEEIQNKVQLSDSIKFEELYDELHCSF